MIVLEQTESQPIMSIPKRRKEDNEQIKQFVVKRQSDKSGSGFDESKLKDLLNASLNTTKGKGKAQQFSLKTEDDFYED